ncbi:AmmeMemoRadiSam system radical SAM enzyme [Candidatus Marinamargulisbacteria bacterium SCGC AAA071-K20]|nr:AmmeMemoRadiSam system radical SAM enzyme [Candidatus Marinamargulisbacteria bacterium SCGC AAA071-K20]
MTATSVKGKWWQPLNDEKIQCNLCPRHCQLKEGVRGFCYVRQNTGGEMFLTTYGRSSGFCVDPIEKKPLNHFYPGSSILSFGTAGCNLGCKFCQNWDISKSREMDKIQELASPEAIATKAKELGCIGVAFTYNDPVIFAEYAIDVAKECRKLGLKTVAVTAGYITEEARGEFFEFIDAVNVDLKAFTQTFYKKLCMSDLQPVLDTLKYLKHHTNIWFEITNLVIPTKNDSLDEIKAMIDWVVENLGLDIPLHFTAFHPDYRLLNIPKTPPELLKEIRGLAIDKGIKYVYTGNIVDPESASTYCPNCKALIIERNWHELGKYDIKNGACSQCNTGISGIFSNKKGHWGRKRSQITI